MTSPSFVRVATCTASTKRPPVFSGGKAGVPATQISSLVCTRPVTPSNVHELEQSLNLDTLLTVKVVYTQDDLDIKTGDTLIISTPSAFAGTFPIRLVNPYPFGSDIRKELTIEVSKR
jgi:hypothetical protein